MIRFSIRICLALFSGVFAANGCVQSTYLYGVQAHPVRSPPDLELAQNMPIAIGGEHPVVDRIEAAVQSPGRWLRTFSGAEQISLQEQQQRRCEAIELSQTYLTLNQMNDVCIDVRRYEPGQQWERLRANDRISTFWKYTAGTLDVVGYSIFPRRAFHSDCYSPYTNTLSLNSTKPLEALYEAAAAKQFLRQRFVGSYAAMQRLPLLPLIHHVGTTRDVLTYARQIGDSELEHQLYPAAYARLGGAVVSEAWVTLPAADQPFYVGGLLGVAGGVVGQSAGEFIAERDAGKRATDAVESIRTNVRQRITN